MQLKDCLSSKRVLFITTKNLNYIRNVQELELIKTHARSYYIVGSNQKTYVFRMVSVFMQLRKVDWGSIDTIFMGFAPQLILPLIRKQLRGRLVIQDFFISLYDTFCLDRKRFASKGLFGYLLHQLDRRTLDSSDIIITDTNAQADFFVSEFGADRTKMLTLYLDASYVLGNASLKEMALSSDSHDEELQARKGRRFTVLYFGTILPLQGVDVILDAIEQLRDEPHIEFEIIGPIKGKLAKAAPKSPQITYISWLDEVELYQHIRRADLCLAGHFSSTIAKADRTIPGKAYIYQALKRPMILGDTVANHEIFDSSNPMVHYVPTGDANALAASILKLAKPII